MTQNQYDDAGTQKGASFKLVHWQEIDPDIHRDDESSTS